MSEGRWVREGWRHANKGGEGAKGGREGGRDGNKCILQMLGPKELQSCWPILPAIPAFICPPVPCRRGPSIIAQQQDHFVHHSSALRRFQVLLIAFLVYTRPCKHAPLPAGPVTPSPRSRRTASSACSWRRCTRPRSPPPRCSTACRTCCTGSTGRYKTRERRGAPWVGRSVGTGCCSVLLRRSERHERFMV